MRSVTVFAERLMLLSWSFLSEQTLLATCYMHCLMNSLSLNGFPDLAIISLAPYLASTATLLFLLAFLKNLVASVFMFKVWWPVLSLIYLIFCILLNMYSNDIWCYTPGAPQLFPVHIRRVSTSLCSTKKNSVSHFSWNCLCSSPTFLFTTDVEKDATGAGWQKKRICAEWQVRFSLHSVTQNMLQVINVANLCSCHQPELW